MKFLAILEVEDRYYSSFNAQSRVRKANKRSSIKSHPKTLARKQITHRKPDRSRQNVHKKMIKQMIAPLIEESENWPMREDYWYETDYDEDYDYDYEEYHDRWDNQWEDEWRPSSTSVEHDAISKDSENECSICCSPIFDFEYEAQPPFDKTFSFCQALLTPRAPVKHQRREEDVTRAVVSGERGVCLDCMMQHLKSMHHRQAISENFLAVEIGNSTGYSQPRIRCPRCPRRFLDSNSVVEWLKRDDCEDKASARALCDAFEAAMVRYQVLRGGDGRAMMSCINVACNDMFLVDVAHSRCSHIACPSCRTAMCFVCRHAYHYGQTCSQFIAGDAALTWKHEQTRACPRCHESIEKNLGCDHMHCWRCQHDFSWSRVAVGIYMPRRSQHTVVLCERESGKPRMISARRLERGAVPLVPPVPRKPRGQQTLRRIDGPSERRDTTLVDTTDRYVVGMHYIDRASQRRREKQRKKRDEAFLRALMADSAVENENDHNDNNDNHNNNTSCATAAASASVTPTNDVPIFMRSIQI